MYLAAVASSASTANTPDDHFGQCPLPCKADDKFYLQVLEHDDVSHLEEYQEYMLRGKECLGRLV